jgi:hypothetical protein
MRHRCTTTLFVLACWISALSAPGAEAGAATADAATGVAASAAAAPAAVVATAAEVTDYADPSHWLCWPGRAESACDVDLSATVVEADCIMTNCISPP